MTHFHLISKESSTNAKYSLLLEALQSNLAHLYQLLYDLGVNYKINTYITTNPHTPDSHPEESNYEDLYKILKAQHTWLSNGGKRPTKEEWVAILGLIASVTTKEDYSLVVKACVKDFTIGVGVKTYNKAAKQLGLPEVPFYDTMRVSSVAESKINYTAGAFVGLKKDGVNATIERNSLIMSRNGQVIMLPHLEQILHKYTQSHVFFGELVSTTRQSSSGLVNSAIKSGLDTKLPVHNLAIHIFDVLSVEEYESRNFKTPFKERIKLAEALVAEINHELVKFVDQTIVYSQDEATKHYEMALELGEEGVIINDPDGLFMIDRSKHRARMKAELTAEVRIIGTTIHNKHSDWVGSLKITSEDGVVSDVGSGLTEQMMKDFFKESPINKIITINYNGIIPDQTGTGWTFFLPTIGKDKTLRFDKDEVDNVLPKK